MIDRSNPLPIHQFPSLIDEVARLIELEAARNPDCDRTIFAYLEALQDAAPFLLAVAGQFQATDAMLLEWMLETEDEFEQSMWTEELQEQIGDMLRRMLAAAKVMEEHICKSE